MTQEINLKAEERKNTGGKLEKISAIDVVYANVYGENFANRHIKMKAQDVKKAYEIAGESNLVELQINNEEPMRVMFKEVQNDVIKGNIIHVDFYKVNMAKKITTEIPLEFVGESNAVKNLGGSLMKNFNSIEVECLPGDLVDHIDVDISSLNTLEDSIKLEDIKIPKGMELLGNASDVIATIAEPEVEEENPIVGLENTDKKDVATTETEKNK